MDPRRNPHYFYQVMDKLKASLRDKKQIVLADEIKRLTMREMFERLTKQRNSLLQLKESIKQYQTGGHQVEDIAGRLKDAGLYSKSQATSICRLGSRVETSLALLNNQVDELKNLIDQTRKEVE